MSFFEDLSTEINHSRTGNKNQVNIITSSWKTVRLIKGYVPISISTIPPKWFIEWDKFKEEKSLIPPHRVWKEFGKISNEEWKELYYFYVLKKLDPIYIIERINKGVLLSWESPETFSYRGIIADWIEKETGILIKEFGFEIKQSSIKPFTQTKFL